MIKTTTENYV